MTLQEAIVELKRNHAGKDFEAHEFESETHDHPDEAIATILNAVVKGELKHDDDR